jgi:hypothetical protein
LALVPPIRRSKLGWIAKTTSRPPGRAGFDDELGSELWML